MPLQVDAFYDQNQLQATCVICGRGAGGRFSPPIRYVLRDETTEYGDVCERCAYGSIDLWRVALTDHAIRLETEAALLRTLVARLDDAQPAPEGIAEELLRKNLPRRGRPPFPPFLR
ncbi:MAG TPA: hypothetical protein ENI95_07045 [Chloroflexi bacterium]|nr:hypothetical protein [Chloroflexota bacterium]